VRFCKLRELLRTLNLLNEMFLNYFVVFSKFYLEKDCELSAFIYPEFSKHRNT